MKVYFWIKKLKIFLNWMGIFLMLLLRILKGDRIFSGKCLPSQTVQVQVVYLKYLMGEMNWEFEICEFSLIGKISWNPVVNNCDINIYWSTLTKCLNALNWNDYEITGSCRKQLETAGNGIGFGGILYYNSCCCCCWI